MRQIQAVIAAMCALVCVACAPIVSNRGHVTETDLHERAVVGETTKREMQLVFGSPSAESTFGDDTWYYIRARKEAQAFFKPEITDQQVIAVVFDEDDVVKEIEDFGLDDAQQVVAVDKVTPTEGHSIGFFEQVMGNLGRFNKDRDTSVTPGRGPGR